MKGWKTRVYGLAPILVGVAGMLGFDLDQQFIVDWFNQIAVAVGTGIVLLRQFTDSPAGKL